MQAPSATSDSDLVESKLPRLRAKSELAEYVGRRVYLKDAITVGLSERGTVILVKTTDCKLLRVLVSDVIPQMGMSVDVIGVVHTMEELQARTWKLRTSNVI